MSVDNFHAPAGRVRVGFPADLTLGKALALLASAVAFFLATCNPYFFDMAWQAAEGREILSGHFPTAVPYAIVPGVWHDHEWLFEVCLAPFYAHQMYYPIFLGVLSLFAAAVPLCVYAMLARRSDAPNNDLTGGIVALICALFLFEYNACRPLGVAVFFFTLILMQLRGGKISYPAIGFITLLWANIHASVLLAPLLVCAYGVGARLKNDHIQARKYLIAGGLAAAVILINPEGYHVYTYAFDLTSEHNTAIRFLSEWFPFTFQSVRDIGIVALLACVLFGWKEPRIGFAERAITLFFIAFSFHQKRQMAFLAPAAAMSAGGIASYVKISARAVRSFAFTVPVMVLATAVWILGLANANAGRPFQRQAALNAIIADAAAHHAAGNAYLDYNSAAYIHQQVPALRPLLDSHGDAFPAAVITAWDDLNFLKGAWRSDLKHYGIRVVIVFNATPLATVLGDMPGWHLAARNATYSYFTRVAYETL